MSDNESLKLFPGIKKLTPSATRKGRTSGTRSFIIHDVITNSLNVFHTCAKRRRATS